MKREEDAAWAGVTRAPAVERPLEPSSHEPPEEQERGPQLPLEVERSHASPQMLPISAPIH